LAVGALTHSDHETRGGGLFIEFPDNRLLVDLCGEYDRNLLEIENKLDVEIVRRGNQISIHGDGQCQKRAADLLKSLYQRLEQGHAIQLDDIDQFLTRGVVSFAGRSCDQKSRREGETDRLEIVTQRKVVEPRNTAQAAYIQTLQKHELTFGVGPAGTGKTYLAVAVGVSMFLTDQVDRIILSRPAVEAGEKLGYLPGDMKDKVDPYMQPLYDALRDFLPSNQVRRLIDDKTIEIAPIAFLRGRTLSRAFVVLDEAQNATIMQMKMFLTRLGRGSRMVITGDRTQVDLPVNVPSGLAHAEGLLKGIHNIGFSVFHARDVVRHPLVARIIEAYDESADGCSS